MENVKMSVKGNILLVEIDLTKEFGLSSTGKSKTVASTKGNVAVPGHEDVKIGINCYRPVK
jgi:hypothetical protein